MIVSQSKFMQDSLGNEWIVAIFERALTKSLKTKGNLPSVFISHKHGEQDYVYQLIKLLRSYDFEGYIDWLDDEMPKVTSGETADKIKEKISSLNKFILIASEAAINSKWCNWELGYGDAHKYLDSIAILPIKNDDKTYNGQEYLSIYPSIQIYSENEQTNNYYVEYPDGQQKPFSKWLLNN